MSRLHTLAAASLVLTFAATAQASNPAPAESSAHGGHGPASDCGFSHRFSSTAHTPEGVQLSFHYGLLQPLLLDGFNAAVDVRVGRFIATYSHGQGLDMSDLGTDAERQSGARIFMPYSTGFGIGAVLIDELYALVDFKLHAVEVSLGDARWDYKTATIGGELGYRLFLYKGLHVAPVIRYWPRVWSSLPEPGRHIGAGGPLHTPVDMGNAGLFANLLVGWAFDV